MNKQELWDKFCHRKDMYCLMEKHPIQNRENYYRRVFEPLTIDLVEKHLKGEITIGVFPTKLEDMTVKFICWDVDDPSIDINIIWNYAKTIGEPLLEASGTKDRYHIWVFFNEPIPLSEARKHYYNCHMNGIDFFPNKDKIINDYYYELPIKLPLGFHKKAKKWSQFIDWENR